MTLLFLSLPHCPLDPNRLPFLGGLSEPIAKILETLFDVGHAHFSSSHLGEPLLYINKTAKALFPNVFVIPVHNLESKIDYGLYLFPTEFLAVIRESFKRFQKLVVGYQVVTRLALHKHGYF